MTDRRRRRRNEASWVPGLHAGTSNKQRGLTLDTVCGGGKVVPPSDSEHRRTGLFATSVAIREDWDRDGGPPLVDVLSMLGIKR